MSTKRSVSCGAFPKVALVVPAWTQRTGAKLAAMPDLYPPMGLGCIASALRAAHFEVTIIDMPILGLAEDDDDAMVQRLRAFAPDIVGFTTVTMTYPTVVRQAWRVKSIWPALPVIVGGVHVTDAPDTTLRDRCFDYSVAGEGERSVVELCDGIVAGSVPDQIPGVGYHSETPYAVARDNPDIASLPNTAYDLFDLNEYKRIYRRMSIMTSRGCNARCIFCSSGYSMPRVKFLPLERVMSELTYLVQKIGFTHINIYDSNFTYKKEWVHKVCDEIIGRGLAFSWRCFSKSNGVDLELFLKMRRAGCTHVLFGVESSHDKTLDLIRKGNRRRHVEGAFSLARQAGLKRIAYSIVGLPGETRGDVLETIDFIEALDPEWNVVSPISLMPGTPLHDRMADYNMSLLDPDWSSGSRGDATATNSILSSKEIEELCEYAFKRLNRNVETYQWHEVVAAHPDVCPHIGMMSLIDPS